MQPPTQLAPYQGSPSLPADWPAPLAIARPAYAADVVAAVGEARAKSFALVPVGGGTRLDMGFPPSRDYAVLLTTGLDQLIDYQPDDMTVTCQPGISLAALAGILAERGQRLPLDTSLPARSTLGGVFSSSASGLSRAALGGPRDLLLGLLVVTADAQVVKGGGRVVKNVAGYDLPKLFIGAWGTLGCIVEMTLRVGPIPERELTLAWRAPSVPEAASAARQLWEGRLALTAAAATDEPDGRARLVVRLEGGDERVEWQRAEICARLHAAGWSAEAEEWDADDQTALRDAHAAPGAGDAVARVICLPAELAALLSALAPLQPAGIVASAGDGVVSMRFMEPAPGLAPAIVRLLPAQSRLTWPALPPAARPAAWAPWGPPDGTHTLQRGLKQALDPDGLFSPGRFLAGL